MSDRLENCDRTVRSSSKKKQGENSKIVRRLIKASIGVQLVS